MPYGLKEIELAKLSKVFASNEHIKRVILYGSRAKGNYKLFSDVDITLEGPELTLTDLNHLSLAIDDLLLPYQFDISIFHTLKNHDLIDHIQRIGITIFERESEWKEYKLEEIAEILDYKRRPLSSMERSKRKGKYPYYGASGIIDTIDDYIFEGEHVLISEDGENLRTRQTPIAFLADGQFWVNNHAHIVKSDWLHNRLICYYFANLDLNPYITGAVQPKLSQESLNRIPLLLPESTEERKRIVSILSSLDDKIDLLHRENATLEQMAETLFRQWFVVEAKEEWKGGTIVDFAKHCKDSINPQKHPNTVFQHYSIPAFDDGKKPTAETGENIQSNKYLVPTNCILFSKLNPHKDKRVWLMLDDVPDNAICSTEFQIVKPIKPEYLYFLYGWLTNKENYDEIASGVGGTSGSHQRIDPKSVFSFNCPNVDSDTIRNYNNMVEPLFFKIRNNQKQIQTLIQTRDELLPRLMNNEITIEV